MLDFFVFVARKTLGFNQIHQQAFALLGYFYEALLGQSFDGDVPFFTTQASF
jgi:hypothetical protein